VFLREVWRYVSHRARNVLVLLANLNAIENTKRDQRIEFVKTLNAASLNRGLTTCSLPSRTFDALPLA
jgi:hypothetical protein